MKALKIAAVVVVALVGLVTAVGFMLPSKQKISRSVTINAPAPAIYPLVSNFKTGWTQWNPWGQEMDSALQMSFSGAEQGVGAVQSWDSPKSGDGSMKIVRAEPTRGVEYDMVMMHESFRVTGSLLCEPAGSGTKLTWTGEFDYGNNPYRRYLSILFEGPLKKDYDRGLAALKQKAEARVAEASLSQTAIQ